MGTLIVLAVAVSASALTRISSPVSRFFASRPPVPANVARALCFYQKISPLGRGVLKAAADFKGVLIQERIAQIHSAVDDDPVLHRRVIAEIEALRA